MMTVNTMEVKQNANDSINAERILAHQLGKRYLLTSQQSEQVSGGWPLPVCWNTYEPDGYVHRDCDTIKY